jgi:hypothetical protein
MFARAAGVWLRRKAQVTAVNARKPKSDARLMADPPGSRISLAGPQRASARPPRSSHLGCVNTSFGVSSQSRPRSLIHFDALSAHTKFVRDDFVKVIETGEIVPQALDLLREIPAINLPVGAVHHSCCFAAQVGNQFGDLFAGGKPLYQIFLHQFRWINHT